MVWGNAKMKKLLIFFVLLFAFVNAQQGINVFAGLPRGLFDNFEDGDSDGWGGVAFPNMVVNELAARHGTYGVTIVGNDATNFISTWTRATSLATFESFTWIKTSNGAEPDFQGMIYRDA